MYALIASVVACLPWAGATSLSSLVRRTATDYNVDYYAALGDSFHAGPGAGNKINDGSSCNRYNQALGPQIDGDANFLKSTPLARNFKNLACTGDKMPAMQAQIDSLDPKTQMATLTIGGNDVFFGSIVNSCVYMIYPGWSCQSNVDASRNLMNTQGFKDDLKNVYQSIMNKVPDINLYVLGYPQFFERNSDQCSNTCFQFGVPQCSEEAKLTVAHRDRLNDLVIDLDQTIEAQVKAVTPKGKGSITYVDVDQWYQGHRFCEPGVTEPDYNNPNIWFYPFTWTKRNWLTSFKNSTPTDCPAINERGDYGERYDCDLAGFIKNNGTQYTNLINNKSIPWSTDVSTAALPDWALRMFHPTIAGFTQFKAAVYDDYHNGVQAANASTSPTAIVTASTATATATATKASTTAKASTSKAS